MAYVDLTVFAVMIMFLAGDALACGASRLKIRLIGLISYGCEPEFSIPCNHTDESSFVQLAHAEFYGSDIFFYQNVTFQFCQEQCLNRCDCNDFQYNYNEGSGYYNRYPKYLLMSGHQSPLEIFI